MADCIFWLFGHMGIEIKVKKWTKKTGKTVSIESGSDLKRYLKPTFRPFSFELRD